MGSTIVEPNKKPGSRPKPTPLQSRGRQHPKPAAPRLALLWEALWLSFIRFPQLRHLHGIHHGCGGASIKPKRNNLPLAENLTPRRQKTCQNHRVIASERPCCRRPGHTSAHAKKTLLSHSCRMLPLQVSFQSRGIIFSSKSELSKGSAPQSQPDLADWHLLTSRGFRAGNRKTYP